MTDILRRAGRGPAAGTEASPRSGGLLQPVDWREGAEPEAVAIPTQRRGLWASRAVLVRERSAVAEQFRHFAVRIRRSFERAGRRTLMVTSPMRAEGKTTVSCNLALALASVATGRRVALVEFDLRRPRVAAGLGVQPEVGIEEVLAGEASLSDARIPTEEGGLDLFLVKEPELRAHELLSSPDLAGLVQALADAYTVVVFDTPPVLLVPDAPLVAPQLDAFVMVVRRGRTRSAALASALDLLPAEKRLGAFVNESRLPVRARHYAYYADQ